MPKLIRRACLTNYVEVASSVGLDPYRQFKAAGLSRACLADTDTMIRASVVRCLLEASAKTAGVELATRDLTTTDRPLAEVADLLGFSGLSALSRWFSGRFDCSASAWRAAQRGRMVPAR